MNLFTYSDGASFLDMILMATCRRPKHHNKNHQDRYRLSKKSSYPAFDKWLFSPQRKKYAIVSHSIIKKCFLAFFISSLFSEWWEIGADLTLTTRQAWADDRSTLIHHQSFFSQNVNIIEFNYYICNLHEECIRISTNMPGIGWVIPEIGFEVWEIHKKTHTKL